MATKIYNRVTHTFMVNGNAVSFYCSTTNTRNGFCHHVYTWGLGKDGEHTRVSYYNRTWETFDYETALSHAVAKFPKAVRAALELEIEAIALNEREKAERFIKAFTANFNALSDEQREFVREHTPHLETMDQAKAVGSAVAIMAAM